MTRRLRADGVEVIDVPAQLATRVRVLSIGHGRKNDGADALSQRAQCFIRSTQRTERLPRPAA